MTCRLVLNVAPWGSYYPWSTILQSSHGDKVQNHPIVLAMWDVTLMYVPQLFLLDLLWWKLGATLGLHGRLCPFNAVAGWIWKTCSEYADPKSTKHRLLLELVCQKPPKPISCCWGGHGLSLFLRGRLAASAQTWVHILYTIVSVQFSVTENPLKKYHLSK